MNLNNINKRLERIYLSIDESIDKNLYNSLEFAIDLKTKQPLGFKIDPQAKADTEHRLLTIIHNIASLKDHLKKKYNRVESEISKCLELQLIIDIDNADKHGYNSKLRSRSKLFPKVSNIDRVIRCQKGDRFEWTEKKRFYFDSETKKATSKTVFTIHALNGSILITADIVDKNGVFIIKFQDMINKSLSKWEEIINRVNKSS